MPRFRRTVSAPPHVLAQVELERGDQLLANAPLSNGDWLVASVFALHRVPGGADPTDEGAQGDDVPPSTAWRREWTDVDRAALDSESRTLAVRWATGQGEERYELDDGVSRTFTRTVNERITASVLASQELKLPGGRARIAVRRRPNGELFSHVLLLGAVNSDEPDVARQIDAVEAQLRDSCGLD